MSPLLDYKGAATALGLKNDTWLRRHIRRLPHEKYGRAVRFSEEHIAEIRRIHSVRPTELPASVAVGPAMLVPLGASRRG
ncbi:MULTISPECIES: hypothetical protein [Streptomycetaceae]|uniref:hypothetical protein n=1 Tax=Streptomycetaceae TaxID=2062 RepID=UPI00093DD9DF|nr:hypothetical protein [Streptomyces sp. CB02056]OKI08803.1 hypothetical protein AMK13_10405 [Streptomyces sp. CB02056]